MDLRNKNITVVGLANSGMGSVLSLHEEGAVVSVTDNSDTEEVRRNAEFLKEKYIDIEIGGHTEDFLKHTEILIVSPGVEDTALPIRYAEKNSIPVISELELGSILCKGRIVAVTGTNGKSTVVSLLGEVLKEAGISVVVCGNIGNSLTGELKNIKEDTIVILEVSSFQLERIATFRPFISVILNVTDDHMDRHKSFEKYLAEKKKIFKNQKSSDFTVLNYDDVNLKTLGEKEKIPSKVLYYSTKKKVEGIFLDKDGVKTYLRKKIKWLFKIKNLRLKGKHNTENILAVSLVSVILGIKKDVIEKAIESFNSLPHRFETVDTVKGIEFIDDSKATNVDSTYKALMSLTKPVILIAGGKDKKLSYDKILPVLKKKAKEVILIGETKSKMSEIFKSFIKVKEKSTLQDAVRSAFRDASKGDVVLLSPMCSSFDMFKNYKERGEVFIKAVKDLPKP